MDVMNIFGLCIHAAGVGYALSYMVREVTLRLRIGRGVYPSREPSRNHLQA